MARHFFINPETTFEGTDLPLRSIRMNHVREDEIQLFEDYLSDIVIRKAPDIIEWLSETEAGSIQISYNMTRNKRGKFMEMNLLIAFRSENDAMAFRLRFM